MRKATWGLAVLALLLLGAAWLSPRPMPTDPAERIQILIDAGRAEEAQEIAFKLLESDPTLAHARLLAASYEDGFLLVSSVQGDLEKLAQKKTHRDAALYALGMLSVNAKEYGRAVSLFQKMARQHQRYVPNSIGRCLQVSGKPAEAEKRFREELALTDGNFIGATHNLELLYVERGDAVALEALSRDPQTSPHLTADARLFLLLRGRPGWGTYGALVLTNHLRRGGYAWAGALAIAALWIYLLWRIDAFETEPLGVMLGVFLLGCLSTMTVCDLAYEVLRMVHPHPPGDPDQHYFIFHVGVAEELTKLLPVMLFCRFSRHVNEPVDYLIYGSLSALGFATIENTMYFDNYAGGAVMIRRFILCVIGHITWTAFICYVWARRRHYQKSPWLAGLVAFGAAVLVHGLYDDASPYWKMAITVGEALLYTRMLSDALSWSPFLRSPRELSARWANQEPIELVAVLMLLIPFAQRHLEVATEVAWRGLLDAASLQTLGLAAAVFVPLEIVGLQHRRALGQYPTRLGALGSLLRNLVWLWGVTVILMMVADEQGWLEFLTACWLTVATVGLATRLRPSACRGERARRRQRRLGFMSNLIGGWWPDEAPPTLARAVTDLEALGFAVATEAVLLPADATARRQLLALWRRDDVVAVVYEVRSALGRRRDVAIKLWTPLADSRELVTSSDWRVGYLDVPERLVQLLPGCPLPLLVEAHQRALPRLAAPALEGDLADVYLRSLKVGWGSFLAVPLLRTVQVTWRTLSRRLAAVGVLTDADLEELGRFR